MAISKYLPCAISSAILRRPKPLCYIPPRNSRSDIYCKLTPYRRMSTLFILQNVYFNDLLSYPTTFNLNQLNSLIHLAMNVFSFPFRVPECFQFKKCLVFVRRHFDSSFSLLPTFCAAQRHFPITISIPYISLDIVNINVYQFSLSIMKLYLSLSAGLSTIFRINTCILTNNTIHHTFFKLQRVFTSFPLWQYKQHIGTFRYVQPYHSPIYPFPHVHVQFN